MVTLKLKATLQITALEWKSLEIEEGDVWKKTTAASLRKSLQLKNNSFDRGSVLYTDPSYCIHPQGQVLMNMP